MSRILITGFCAVPAPARSGVQLRHVVRALRSHHHVELLVLRSGDQAYVERLGGVRTLRVPVPDLGNGLRGQAAAFQRALRRQLEGAEYDIVHCRDSIAAPVVREVRTRQGFAMVYDLARAPIDHDTDEQAFVDELVSDETAAIREADLVLVASPAAVQYAVRCGARRVRVAPVGVDVDRFDWESTTPTVDTILYAGPIAPGRGVRLLIRAVAMLRTSRPAVPMRLRLVGPIAPNFAEALDIMVRDAGLRDVVELVGEVGHERMPSMIADSTICVAPAGSDLQVHGAVGCPTKVLEYLACRRPVVAPLVPAMASVIEPGIHGLLFTPDDPVSLARSIAALLSNKDLAQRVAHAGYALVRQGPTASACRRAIKDAYTELEQQFASRFAVRAGLAGGSTPALEVPAFYDDVSGDLSDADDEHTVFDTVKADPGTVSSLSAPGAPAIVAGIIGGPGTSEHHVLVSSNLVDDTNKGAPAPSANRPPRGRSNQDSGRWDVPNQRVQTETEDVWMVVKAADTDGPAKVPMPSNLPHISDEDDHDGELEFQPAGALLRSRDDTGTVNT